MKYQGQAVSNFVFYFSEYINLSVSKTASREMGQGKTDFGSETEPASKILWGRFYSNASSENTRRSKLRPAGRKAMNTCNI